MSDIMSGLSDNMTTLLHSKHGRCGVDTKGKRKWDMATPSTVTNEPVTTTTVKTTIMTPTKTTEVMTKRAIMDKLLTL